MGDWVRAPAGNSRRHRDYGVKLASTSEPLLELTRLFILKPTLAGRLKSYMFEKKAVRTIWSSTHLLILSLGLTSMVALWADSPATAAAKAKYNHKFAEVLQDGLSVGYCAGTRTQSGEDVSTMRDPNVFQVIRDSGPQKVIDTFGCPVRPIHKGDVLLINNVRTRKQGEIIFLDVSTSPQSVTRGIGANEHQSVEIGRIQFTIASTGDPDPLISQWLRISDTAPSSKLGNTASGVKVKEVKLGMSVPEVEEALGVPVTRIDLGAKVLYKYKDMTVEFQDGKVTDVR
jgi:hypothetical protein